MEGGCKSMKVVYAVTLNFAPKTIAWGRFKSNNDLHYFLCDFYEMDEELPERIKFSATLSQLYHESSSPNGKFAFHPATNNGKILQDFRCTDTSEKRLVNGTPRYFELVKYARGPNEELKALTGYLFDKVISPLLRPLKSRGRMLKPSFMHGGLWYGNDKLLCWVRTRVLTVASLTQGMEHTSPEHPIGSDAAGLENEFLHQIWRSTCSGYAVAN